MHSLIVYESIYGATHTLASAIACGLREAGPVKVVPVTHARHERLADYELLLVGGPTQAHGMSRRPTRQAAIDCAGDAELATLEPGAGGIGLREWFDGLGACEGAAAAFDTRLPGPVLLTGQASLAIASRLKRHGFRLVAEPASFLVDAHNHLMAQQEAAAQQWGAALAAAVRTTRSRHGSHGSKSALRVPAEGIDSPVQRSDTRARS